MTDPKYSVQKILEIKPHSSQFITFKITRPPKFNFKAGQFARLGLTEESGQQIWRAYSIVGSPDSEHLEFFAIIMPNGKFSNLLAKFSAGSEILVGSQSFGFLTLDRFQDGQDLWLLATGTGVAPFLSILQDQPVWQQFKRINLVYSARFAKDLAN